MKRRRAPCSTKFYNATHQNWNGSAPSRTRSQKFPCEIESADAAVIAHAVLRELERRVRRRVRRRLRRWRLAQKVASHNLDANPK